MVKKSADGEATTVSRRDEILEVAAEVFAERGIKETTVRDIGEAAGILSGSLYYHFESKEQIVLDLLLPSVQANYERLVSIAAESSGAEALAGLIRATVEVTAQHPHRSRILRHGPQVFGEFSSLEPVADIVRNTVKLWFEVFEQGVETGEIRADIEPEIAVRAMLDATLGASRWFLGSRRIEPASVADHLIALYVSGLAPR